MLSYVVIGMFSVLIASQLPVIALRSFMCYVEYIDPETVNMYHLPTYTVFFSLFALSIIYCFTSIHLEYFAIHIT